jgi:hypothetical protein
MTGSTAWHRGPPETRWQRVYETVSALRPQQDGLEDDFKRCLSEYEERRVDVLGPDVEYTRNFARDDMRYAIARSVVDTVAVEVLGQDIKPMLVTEAGDYAARRDAKRANRAVEGILLEGGLYADTRRDVVLDAMILKTGFVEVVEEEDRVTLERVMPWEVYVDPYDAHYGRPTRILRVQSFEKAQLAERYPEHEAAIWASSAELEHCRYQTPDIGSGDRISVIKGWSLPQGRKPGMRTVCMAGVTLEDEPFEGETLPIVDYRWAPPRKGFWGCSVVEQLRRPQASIDRVHKHIDDTHRLMASAKVIGPPGTNWKKWDNEVGGYFEISSPNGGVQLWQGTGAPPQLYEERERLIRWGFEKIGASMTSSQAQVPRGLQSGPSLRIYLAVGSKRFTMQVKGLESFYVRVAMAIVDAAKRVAKRKPDYAITYESSAYVERIEWQSINLGDVSKWRCWPTSMLPSEPSGRLAALQELFGANLIDRQTFFRVSGFVDFERERDNINAPLDLIERTLDDILADNREILPESVWNIPMCILVGGLTYQRTKLEMGNRPDVSRLAKVRKFVIHATSLLDKWIADQKKISDALAGPPPPAPPGAPPLPPGVAGAPGAPPMLAAAPPVAA